MSGPSSKAMAEKKHGRWEYKSLNMMRMKTAFLMK